MVPAKRTHADRRRSKLFCSCHCLNAARYSVILLFSANRP